MILMGADILDKINQNANVHINDNLLTCSCMLVMGAGKINQNAKELTLTCSPMFIWYRSDGCWYIYIWQDQPER
jgi:hypothetical protein